MVFSSIDISHFLDQSFIFLILIIEDLFDKALATLRVKILQSTFLCPLLGGNLMVPAFFLVDGLETGPVPTVPHLFYLLLNWIIDYRSTDYSIFFHGANL